MKHDPKLVEAMARALCCDGPCEARKLVSPEFILQVSCHSWQMKPEAIRALDARAEYLKRKKKEKRRG